MLKQVFFEKNCLKLDCIQILFETSAWEFFIILLLLLLLHSKTFIFCNKVTYNHLTVFRLMLMVET